MAETPKKSTAAKKASARKSAAGVPPAAAPADTTPARLPRWRRVLVAFLVVLGCVLAPISVIAVWTHNTLLNTDRYVDTVGPLAADPAIQRALANRVTQVLADNVDIEKEVEDALPAKASFAAPFVAQGIERFVNEAALKLVQTQQFESLWNNVNRRAHARLVTVLKGEGTETVATRDGKVEVNLKPVITQVQDKLESLGVSIFDQLPVGSIGTTFTLFESKDLRSAQEAVKILDTLSIVLPILTVLLLAAALALSGNRRRTLLRSAVGVALAVGLLLVLLRVGRTIYLDALTSAGANEEAAAAAYDQILSFLRLACQTVFVLAVIVAIAAWLGGSGKVATRIRTGVRDLARGDGESGGEATAAGTFVAQYRNVLRGVVVGIGLILLMLLSAPGPVAVLVIALLVVLGLVLIEFLGRRAPAQPVA
jgi:hypothetical protein